jgi:integrase
VGDLGVVRRRKDTRSWYIDLRPYGRIYRNRGIPIDSKKTALRILEQIRSELAAGHSIHRVLATYLPERSRPNRFRSHLERWLEVKRRETEGGSLSPTYFRELERYGKENGYFSFFDELSIYELSYARIEDFSLHLSDLGLSPKTRRNVLGALHVFLGWLRKRGELQQIPEIPLPRVDEHQPRILSIEDQDRILDAIPEERRGIFLALAHLGLRPGEARALEVADYRDGWLTIDKAIKGAARSAPIRGTKTGRGKRLPVGPVLLDWIERWVDPRGRFTDTPLFLNRNTGKRWSHWALRDTWLGAARSVGIHDARLYEGTKHTMATDAVRRGVSERALQTFLGHTDIRSTRRYARLSEEALISVLRPRDLTPSGDDLSRTCPATKTPNRKYSIYKGNLASPTGLEPVLPA